MGREGGVAAMGAVAEMILVAVAMMNLVLKSDMDPPGCVDISP